MRGGAWRRFGANRAAVAGAAVLALIASAAALAPWLAPHDPLAVDLGNSFADSSWRHPLGTDQLGRDTWSRLLHGARVSLLLSVSSVAAALVLGVAAGLTAAWWRGRVDALFVWAADVLLSFPDFLLAIAVIAMLGPGSFSTVVAVAVYALPTIARIARASALGALSRDHVLASRALGARNAWMVWHHVLPLCLSPIVAQATMMLGKAVLMAAGLSFLGLGVPPPEAEWGAMLSRGRDLIRTAPLGAVAPGIAITLVVLSFSMAGDGLRDALDPKN
jgi:peptide/nickel transport system permease protein